MAFSPEPRMAAMALASVAVAPQGDRAASSLPGQDLHFRRIVAVDEVSYKGWVYDLEVAKHHNFVAEQILCHNTIQALAFLQSIYEEQPRPASSLIVMPRSLLFNWQREAAQFTPNLNVYIHADQGRISEAAAFAQHDLILTTYGVMLRDIELLRAYRFHYAILDESQAIKNPLAETSRAARALQADQRLVLTGTPVENSTIELWSQFAFLNPGLLGNLDYFREEFAGPIERKQDVETATFLRKLVYPFILRRTKDQVALDLPPRSEELLITDMEPAQRKLYIKTRDYYRATLLGMIDNEGLDDSRMKILEGLLRLRQICNHPRLVDGKFRGSSAKFELLLETLQTLRAEGHKALIFSQFVQMLSLIREALDGQKIPYAYLDGSTHNRQGEVDRFQNSADLPFFLISLKAGGVGLNLTAADYVIHVDPWWNPAVELQATDRTHRIGQTKPVFVYKLITRDTVEEKILKLQEQKRALVSQLITTEGGVFKLLSRDDVEVLFS
jgi:non-specific serine/threonine protein kinase